MKNEEEGREEGDENIVEGLSLFKVHHTHVWNHHNEISFY
jgi:hypothetical protein